MKKLLLLCAFACATLGAAGSAPSLDLYASAYWEIKGEAEKLTWIEIQNPDEARSGGLAHVSVLARKKDAPVWQVEWIRAHIAITAEALARSVVRPLKIRGSYPEKYLDARRHWDEDRVKGVALVCTTSIQDYLKSH